MRRLIAFASVVLTMVAIACGGGDDPTAPTSPNQPAATPPRLGPSFATATNGEGLSITTDKDDYAPGDTVHFTGAGWQPGDTLDIVLTDDPQSHEPHRWWVLIDGSGGFHDSTYVVDETDLGVTFTLTATSRSNPAVSLGVQFTDGTLQGLALAPLSVTVPVGTAAGYTITVDMSGNTNACTVTLSFAFNNPPGTPANAGPTIAAPNPTTVNPGNVDFSRGLTITTAGVAPGSYPFTITATGGTGCGGSNRTIGGTLVVFGSPAKLAFDQQPTNEEAAQPITPAVTVRVLDVANNLVPTSSDPVSIAIGTNPGSGTLSGTVTRNAVNGVATFDDLKINKVGNGYTLTAASGSLTGATSSPFNITLGAPAELAFTSQPSGGTTGTAFATQPAVEVRDAGGNRITGGQGSGANIVLAIVSGTGTAGAVLSCTTNPLGATNGLATFGGCQINLAGTGYRLRASTTIAGNPFTKDTDPFNVTASAVATTTTVTSSQNPSSLGDAVTFTATVTSGSPALPVGSGQISFKTGGTNCSNATQVQAPQTVDGNGQVTYTPSPNLTLGSHIIRACYGGATGFLPSEGSVTQVVENTATEVTLTSSVNPSKTGQSVTFKAVVKNNGTTITAGTITFKRGGTSCSIGSTEVQGAQALTSGEVTYTASFNASESPITMHACYGGSTTPKFGASEASLVQDVDPAATTTTVQSSSSPSVFSEPVTFTVTVSVVAPGVGTPTGTVKLVDGPCVGGTELGSAGLSGGQATFSNVTTLPVGSHTVRGCYEGNADFAGSSGSVSQTVNRASTTTTITSNANPSVFSQPVTFTVTVAPVSPATATPTGSVTIEQGGTACGNGATVLATKTLSGGEATFQTGMLAVGPHTIRGCYAQTTNFNGSADDVAQTVNKASTTTTIESEPNPSVFSQSVTFKITVAPVAPAVATPAGNVTFEQGGTACGNGTTVLSTQALVSGQAMFSTSALDAGLYTIRGCYAETTNFEASSDDVQQTVDKAGTTTSISSSVNPSILAQPVTFTVTVSSVSPATATPVGNVTLKDGTCTAGTTIGGGAAALSGGQVTFTVSSLSVGIHTVSACYAGTANFEPSDKSLSQQVQYKFDGLYAPVDRPNTLNVSKAGQGVPLKWRLLNYRNEPVLDFSAAALGVAVTMLPCNVSAVVDAIEQYAGNSGLQNLGDGYYQFNWKTPPTYANTCRAIGLDLGEGTPRGPLAYFNFKK
jgi:hypothetical protein